MLIFNAYFELRDLSGKHYDHFTAILQLDEKF